MNLKLLARILIITVIALMIIGSALVLSASSTYSAYRFKDDFYHLFTLHIIKVLIALTVLILFSVIPYDVYRKHSKKAMMLFAGLLVLTFLIAQTFKGAGRWINLWAFSFQPSEVAKFALLMHVASLLEEKGDLIKDYKRGFIYPLIWIIMIAGLIFIQPNVSVSLIVLMTSFSVLFVGGASLKHIFASLATLGGAAGVFMMIFKHSRKRILTFINSLANGGEINIQVAQAKIALGSGGLLGLGLGQSRQSDLFLPESYGDFIFSVLGEELGFLGTAGVLTVYVVIFVMGVIIAKRATDRFGQLLAFGISFSIILSAFINAAVVTGIFPTTGIPLPFISYGGTSIVFTCAAAGILVNIGLKSNMVKRQKRKDEKAGK